MSSPRRAARTALFVAGTLVGGSVLLLSLSAWLVPVMATHALRTWVEAHRHGYRPGIVRFNPLTLTVRATNVAITDVSGATLVAADALEARLAPRSLVDGQLEFANIEADGLTLDLVRDTSGHLNVSDLLPTTDPDAPYPALRIAKLHAVGRSIGWTDRSLGEHPLTVRLNATELRLDDFDTRGTANAFHVQARSDRDETVRIDGTLALQPLSTRAHVSAAGVDLARLGSAGLQRLPIDSGHLDLAGPIEASYSAQGLSVRAELETLDARDLELGPDARIRRLHAAGIGLQTATHTLSVARLEVDGPDMVVRRSREGHVRLAGVAWPETGTGALDWTTSLGHVGIQGATIDMDDERPTGGVTIALTHVGVTIDGWSSVARAPVTVKVSGQVAAAGAFDLTGTIEPAERSASLELHGKDIPLPPLQPYLTPYLPLEIRSGSAGGNLVLTGTEGRLEVTGDAVVDALSTATQNSDLFAVRHLRLDSIEAGTTPPHVSVRSLTAESPSAHIDVAPDGHSNYRGLLAAASNAATPADGTTITIGTVKLEDGTMDFRDRSLKPVFDARVEHLDGRIEGLSSDPASRAQVAITGRVDRYAPVSISGDVNLLASPIAADVALNFENVELTGFTPYAGRFAGYRIDKGKASAHFDYHVANRKIEAKHHVRLKQLELGERVESPAAPELPLRFAVALLKDRDGNIDLDIPLTGSFDDPNFDFGAVVRKVLWNLVGKIVTSPFRLLGALFGHGEETAGLEFMPGSAQLDDADRERLTAIGRALVTRPALSIEIPVAVLPALDTPIVGEDGLEGLGQARATAVQSALLDGTTLDPGRVFIVRNRAPVPSPDGHAVHVELGLR